MTIETSILDILFKNKNKNYGAYELRTNYGKRLYKSIPIMITLCFASIFLLSLTKSSEVVDIFDVQDVVITSVKPLEKVIEKPAPKLASTKQFKTVRFTPPVIVSQTTPTEAINDIKGDEMIGVVNVEGEKPMMAQTVEVIDSTATFVEVDYTKEFVSVETEASFIGGRGEWKKFLEDNLDTNIPIDNEAEAGLYTVVVSFLVDRDGKISEVVALNDPGYGIMQEAIRVIKKSKTWIPATQNNQSVIFRQKQKISFLIN